MLLCSSDAERRTTSKAVSARGECAPPYVRGHTLDRGHKRSNRQTSLYSYWLHHGIPHLDSSRWFCDGYYDGLSEFDVWSRTCTHPICNTITPRWFVLGREHRSSVVPMHKIVGLAYHKRPATGCSPGGRHHPSPTQELHARIGSIRRYLNGSKWRSFVYLFWCMHVPSWCRRVPVHFKYRPGLCMGDWGWQLLVDADNGSD